VVLQIYRRSMRGGTTPEVTPVNRHQICHCVKCEDHLGAGRDGFQRLWGHYIYLVVEVNFIYHC
jgi:hypothetical protein